MTVHKLYMYRMMVYTNWYSYNTLTANDLDIPSCLMCTTGYSLFKRARVTFLKLLVCIDILFYMSYLKYKTTF